MEFYSFHVDVDTQEEVDVLIESDIKLSYQLVVYNDDVNTFDWVIEALMEICGHTHEQATQCSLFIHFKGKYAVKQGDELKLIPMKDALHDRGISASVESCN
ncbi:MAG: ATP-dependent Clp protease adaptor ClpS [Chitinophagales bacterium]|nr:ATP-dependent Clp protease adaptor ClpS [Bacteroidota bacterium]